MKKINHYASAFIFLFILGFLSSCNKDKEVAPSPGTPARPTSEQNFASAKATLDILAEIQSLNNLSATVFMESNTDSQAGARIAALKETQCGVFTYQIDENSGTGTITVDYGSGQSCEDGEQRKGKIIFTTVAGTNADAVLMTAQFLSYEADGKKLDGSYTVGISVNENADQFTYTYNFKDAVLTYADGSKVSWNSNYVMLWKIVMGATEEDMPTFSFEMSGGLSGTNRNGKAFSAQITSPIIIDGNCLYGITKGKYSLKAEGYWEAVYDYGNGECDNKATLTIDGKSETVTIEN